MRLRLGHLFPELLNLYADRGNVASIAARARWRSIDLQVEPISLGSAVHMEGYDIILLGGGSDREQALVGRALRPYADALSRAIEDGLPVLAICGGYQLIGDYYMAASGERIDGLGIVSLVTEAGETRLIGNIAIQADKIGAPVVGFENHAGRTYHDYEPLGTVMAGHGNNGEDGKEGLVYRNLIGTYIHGPLLPKNPKLTDFLLRAALLRRGYTDELSPLDDTFEERAHDTMLSRLSRGGGPAHANNR